MSGQVIGKLSRRGWEVESQRRGAAFIVFSVLLILALALVGCETVASPTTTGATGVGPGTTAANDAAGPQLAINTPLGTNLRYGEVMSLDGLQIAVTVAPSEVGQYANGVPRLRSQVIIENRGSAPREIRWSDFWLLDAGNNRIGPYGVSRETLMAIDPGAQVIQQLDWQITRGREIVKVVYAPDGMMPEEVYSWGPEAITEGPGYPVLKTLPKFRAEDIDSIETRIQNSQGGAPSVQTLWAANNAANVQKIIDLYNQTTLVRSQGYPTYRTAVQVIFHFKDGSEFSIWIGSPGTDTCVIQDTRAGTGGNPPAATGSNPGLPQAYYAADSSSGGWRMNGGPKEISDVVDKISAWASANTVSGISVDLPGSMPSGWAIAKQGTHLGGTGGTDNPAMWVAAGTGARSAGYAVTFTDGQHQLELQLNYPGDLGEVAWNDSGVESRLGGTLKVAQTGDMVIVLIPTPDGLPLYVWGDPSLETEALDLAKEVIECAQL